MDYHLDKGRVKEKTLKPRMLKEITKKFMNPEQITQILETIKTLNLNIDSQTALEIVNVLTPILWFWLIKDTMLSLLSIIATTFIFYFLIIKVTAIWNNNHLE